MTDNLSISAQSRQRRESRCNPGLHHLQVLLWLAVLQIGVVAVPRRCCGQLGNIAPDLRLQDADNHMHTMRKLVQQNKNILVFWVQNEKCLKLLERLYTLDKMKFGDIESRLDTRTFFDGRERIYLPTKTVHYLTEGDLKMRLSHTFDGRGGRVSRTDWIPGPQRPDLVLLLFQDRALANQARQLLAEETIKANPAAGRTKRAIQRLKIQFDKHVLLIPDPDTKIAQKFSFEKIPVLGPKQHKSVPIACFIDQRGLIVCTASHRAVGW